MIRETEPHQLSEIDDFLMAVYDRYGYDFRNYSANTKKTRIEVCLRDTGIPSLNQLSEKVCQDKTFFYEILSKLTITVTDLFRNPLVYRALLQEVWPYLQTFSSFKIWHAGCATGEELFSTMILLKEAGLLDSSVLYGTDINPEALRKAKLGIMSAETIRKGATAYREAGGQGSIVDYFRLNHGYGLFRQSRESNIVFSVHNLATDTSFGEMQLIFCRNVLIYFNETLQNRALELMTDSLVSGGYLCLGVQETLMFSSVDRYYDTIDKQNKIYRKK